MADKSYVVTAAYVTVKTNTPDGPRIVGRYAGTPVPADAPPEWIAHHLHKHMIAEAPPGTPGPPPATGSVAEQGAPDVDQAEAARERPAPPARQAPPPAPRRGKEG
jgi:hypothetical protein